LKVENARFKTWIKYGVKISSWFLGGEIKQFGDINEVIKWISENSLYFN